MKEVIEIKGRNAGPNSLVFVGVHGDETCGVEVFEKELPNLQIDAGNVTFVLANPRAAQACTHFTEANLNRLFKPDDLLSDGERTSYEYGRAQILKTYMHKADFLLDIHASTVPNSKPFIICEDNARDIYRFLPFDLVVSGFEAIEPGGTDDYMNQIGKIGICIECGSVGDAASYDYAKNGLISFLKAAGHLKNDIAAIKQKRIHMHTLYYTKTDHFVLTRQYENFETLPANHQIGTDGNEAVCTPDGGIILFAHNAEKVGSEAFLLGKYMSCDNAGTQRP